MTHFGEYIKLGGKNIPKWRSVAVFSFPLGAMRLLGLCATLSPPLRLLLTSRKADVCGRSAAENHSLLSFNNVMCDSPSDSRATVCYM